MKMKIKNLAMKIAILLILIMPILIVGSYAVGVTKFYGKVGEPGGSDPLKMSPGETRDIYLELQNMVGNQSITLKANLINGSDIAKITDSSDVYEVPAGRKDVRVNLQIHVPDNAKLGDTHDVRVSFDTVKTEGSGQLRFGQSIEVYFDVLLENPEQMAVTTESKNNAWIIYSVIAVLIVIGIMYIIKRKSPQ